MTQQNRLTTTIIAMAMLSLVFLILIPTNELQAAVASARVAITKIASLTVEKMDTDHLYQLEGESRMNSTACLRAGGESMPFRISAISLANSESFAVKSSRSGEQVPYQVVWSASDASYTLQSQQDITEVLQVATIGSCEYNSLSVEIDDALYSVASNDSYTDTLSIIFVIE